MADIVKYPSNAIDGFQSGCLMDLRVRLAIEFLKSPMFQGFLPNFDPTLAKDISLVALDLSTALLELSKERGLIEPLPENNGDLNQPERDQAKRMGSFQVLQQIEANKFSQSEQGKIAAAPMFANPGQRRTN